MLPIDKLDGLSKRDRLALMVQWVQGQLSSETNEICNLSNISAIVYHALGDVNWVGFYCYDGTDLVLGPFQGRPACNRITPPDGVCGHAFSTGEAVNVPDVEAFPGHIACDARSRSEFVCPFRLPSGTMGVLDIDSETIRRFGEEEAKAIVKVVELLEHSEHRGGGA